MTRVHIFIPEMKELLFPVSQTQVGNQNCLKYNKIMADLTKTLSGIFYKFFCHVYDSVIYTHRGLINCFDQLFTRF